MEKLSLGENKAKRNLFIVGPFRKWTTSQVTEFHNTQASRYNTLFPAYVSEWPMKDLSDNSIITLSWMGFETSIYTENSLLTLQYIFELFLWYP